MTTVRPAAFRLKIEPLPQEEPSEPKPTHKARGTSPDRGVIVDVGPGVIEDDNDRSRWDFIREGAVVYYKGGEVINGYVYIEVSQDTIIGHEED